MNPAEMNLIKSQLINARLDILFPPDPELMGDESYQNNKDFIISIFRPLLVIAPNFAGDLPIQLLGMAAQQLDVPRDVLGELIKFLEENNGLPQFQRLSEILALENGHVIHKIVGLANQRIEEDSRLRQLLSESIGLA